MDQYNGYVSFLSHFNGANNSTNFIDETGKEFFLFGNVKISTVQNKFGGSSVYFDGASYLDMNNSTDFSFMGDFTIEYWIYVDPAVQTWGRVLENEAYNVSGGWHFSFNGNDASGSRRLGFQIGNNGRWSVPD